MAGVQSGMVDENGPRRTMSAAHVVGAFALAAALAAGSGSIDLAHGQSARGISSAVQNCHIVIVKVRAKRWVWVRKTRKIHGRLVVVRRHGRIVHVRIRVRYRKSQPKRICEATPVAPVAPITPASGVAPFGPVISVPSEVVVAAPQPSVNISPPTISGTAQEGQTLSASPGTWTNNPSSFSYQWQRCDSVGAKCSVIAPATTSSYALTESDVGNTLRVSVTATNSAAPSAPVISVPSEVVVAAPRPPVNISPPTISGTAQEGQTLSASPGTWTNNPTSFSYQWQRCDSAGASCAAIASATSSSYPVVEADVNSTLRVVVVAFNAAGSSLPANSSPTAVVTSSMEASPHRGVNSHATWYWQVSEAEVKREIAEAAVLGIDFIRIPVEWAKIESGGKGVRGGKALTRLDLTVREAAAHGIKVDGIIATTPHWASPGGAWNDAPAEPEKSLRGFAKWLTERYGTKLVAVSVLNEPNNLENLKSPTGESLPYTIEEGIQRRAYYYVKDVKAVFAGAREGSAAVKVLAGETGVREAESKSLLFLKSCFEGGLPHGEEKAQTGFKGYYDAFGAHVYSEGAAPESTNRSSTKSKIERLHKLLVEQESPVPIWANEWGYSLEDSEAVRAAYVEQGVRMLDTQFPYLEGWAYYQLRDSVNAPAKKEENFGLLNYGFEPRLSFAAFEAGMLAG
jgi:hypothetical protein